MNHLRGARGRDDVVAETRDPSKGQLCGRDPLTLSDLGQTFDDLEIMLESLSGVRSTGCGFERGP